MYIKRALENRIREINLQFPALIVTGSRQIGKTTMLKRIVVCLYHDVMPIDKNNWIIPAWLI